MSSTLAYYRNRDSTTSQSAGEYDRAHCCCGEIERGWRSDEGLQDGYGEGMQRFDMFLLNRLPY